MTLDELNAARARLVDRLINEVAALEGLDLSEGLSPELRRAVADHAELLYEDYTFRRHKRLQVKTDGAVNLLLAQLFDVDSVIDELVHGGRTPDDPLQ